MESNNGVTEKLEQLCRSLSLHPTVDPSIMDNLELEHTRKKGSSRLKYLCSQYIILYVSNEEKVPTRSLKEDLIKMGLTGENIDTILAELSGYIKLIRNGVSGKDNAYIIDPAYT